MNIKNLKGECFIRDKKTGEDQLCQVLFYNGKLSIEESYGIVDCHLSLYPVNGKFYEIAAIADENDKGKSIEFSTVCVKGDYNKNNLIEVLIDSGYLVKASLINEEKEEWVVEYKK